MIYPVTPWSATVPMDIASAERLSGTLLNDYTIQTFNAGDSLWLTVTWPTGGKIAFRLAFGMNSDFDNVSATHVDGDLLITAATRLGSYRIVVSFPKSDQTILRYTTTFRAAFEMLIPYWPRDIVPLPTEGRIENTGGNVHMFQEGGRSGQIFFSYTRPVTGSVFYFQNLTSMTAYCEASETTLTNRVGGSWPEIGFEFPVNKEKPLPAGVEYVISDAFVLLSAQIPQNNFDIATQFLEYLSSVYQLLPKPAPQYTDWPDIAKKAIETLTNNKGCWSQVEGKPYLNAYLTDYQTPVEIMVQLAVSLPFREYVEWSGEENPLLENLESGFRTFYDDRVKSIVRWHPAQEDLLDKSEEQKQEMVMDSWYLHHPLMNLGRLALKGDSHSKQLFLDSIAYTIEVAHHFKYNWPVFYRMTTFEVIKAETDVGKGGEKDVPGSYAHIMLLAWQLTGEKRYLNEAAKAVKSLGGLAFDIFYQANNTAFAAGALVELYKETKEDFYLKLSYCCLAGIFRNVQLWDCNYGFGKHFPNFFAVFPLNDAPYTAAYEELEVYAALTHYLKAANGVDILPSLKVLLPEFVKYAVGRLAYYYPPMLPADMLSDDVKSGEIQKDLWIPLEDIYDGWDKCGQVGQEVYGAGIPFGIVSRQYYKAPNSELVVFCDYPTSGFRKTKRSITFRVAGTSETCCTVILSGPAKTKLKGYAVEVKTTGKYEEVKPDSHGYRIAGGSLVKIKNR